MTYREQPQKFTKQTKWSTQPLKIVKTLRTKGNNNSPGDRSVKPWECLSSLLKQKQRIDSSGVPFLWRTDYCFLPQHQLGHSMLLYPAVISPVLEYKPGNVHLEPSKEESRIWRIK